MRRASVTVAGRLMAIQMPNIASAYTAMKTGPTLAGAVGATAVGVDWDMGISSSLRSMVGNATGNVSGGVSGKVGDDLADGQVPAEGKQAMARRVTLREVSREAGVGIATVSRALADHPDVSDETREHVRRVAQRLGYRPSVAARALRRGGFHAISMIVPDNEWGWWEPVVHGAFAAAGAAGYQVLVHPISGVEGGTAAVVRGLENVPTEGVIVISVPDQRSVCEACERIGIPGVAIDDSSAELHFPSVSAANREGAAQVVAHLVSQGCSRIAFLRPTLDSLPADRGDGLYVLERGEGYRDALTAAGIGLDEQLIVEVEHTDEGALGCRELGALLDSGAAPDAVFCAFDGIAPRVLRELDSRGLRVPADIAVAGFDDERAAILLNPQLTSARQPYDEMGRAAVDLLLRAIGGEALEVTRHELPTTLVVRGSTRSDRVRADG